MRNILVINGHPDPSPDRFCAALADSYAEAARAAGHQISRLAVGEAPADFVTSKTMFDGEPPQDVAALQEMVRAAEHVVLIYPLWLGTMPARLKAFLEQLGRGHFFIGPTEGRGWPAQKMRGRSARIIVTMGMPGLAYRLFFGAHSLRALEVGIFGIAGFKPVRDLVLGGVEADQAARERMLHKVARLGRQGI